METTMLKVLCPGPCFGATRPGCRPPIDRRSPQFSLWVARLYYVVEMSATTGILYYDEEEDKEVRLFHGKGFYPRGVFIKNDYEILTTVANDDGSVHIILLDDKGREKLRVTSGDCVDENPCCTGDKIFYQSKGIARRQTGEIAAYSHTVINELNTATGEIREVVSDASYDYMLPKLDGQGNLYFIKIPYKDVFQYGSLHFVKDALMFPYRVVLAGIAFLNAFSIFWTKKPLKTSGGPVGEIDASKRIIHGRLVDIRNNMRREGKRVVAPREWKLMKKTGDEIKELASNILCYDVNKDGDLLLSDGYGVYDAAGKELSRGDEIITSVIW